MGTSFAAPIVSGVVALMQEANPELGWRDVQDILVRTAVVIDIDPDSLNDSWVTIAAGLSHSYEYGFGKVDTRAAVILAQNNGATNVKHNFDLVFTSSPSLPSEPISLTLFLCQTLLLYHRLNTWSCMSTSLTLGAAICPYFLYLHQVSRAS